jgi:hypothetical protein
MPLIIYQPVNVKPEEFVNFWAARYSYSNQAFYDANAGQELTETRILDLFTWKNGTPLSDAKRESVLRNFVARRAELDQVQQNEPAARLLSRFSEGGAIWRIFWLHCWQPARFPIYDQHVHRAMRFIDQGVVEEIPSTNPQKIRVYLNSYLAFHARFDGFNFRLVDKALWAFGKFLNENNFPAEAPR